jgi:hypothetical protein
MAQPYTPEQVRAAVGEAVTKVAVALVVRKNMLKLQAYLEPIQIAIGTRSGAELVIHTLRQQFCGPCVIMTVDVANAFNSMPRDQMLQGLYACPCPEEFYSVFEFEYGSPSNLYLHLNGKTHTLLSQCGSRQGGPAAG